MSEDIRIYESSVINGKYQVDGHGFLLDPDQWDKGFAEKMAKTAKITDGLTDEHWRVLHFIRDEFEKTGTCPLVYQACSRNDLSLVDLKRLFPTGYLRGACKLAGRTYREGYLKSALLEKKLLDESQIDIQEKIYRMDRQGFLIDPYEWDEDIAAQKAAEMKCAPLTDGHWRIIRFLRDYFQQHQTVPTLYETCEANQIELAELERMFPDGYHRGAIKIAGLRAR